MVQIFKQQTNYKRQIDKEIDAGEITKLLKSKIESIIVRVKEKLFEDAKKDKKELLAIIYENPLIERSGAFCLGAKT